MRKTYDEYNDLYPENNDILSFGTYCNYCKEKYNFIVKDIVWGNGNKQAKLIFIGKDSGGED